MVVQVFSYKKCKINGYSPFLVGSSKSIIIT